jgi:hypothetical protein
MRIQRSREYGAVWTQQWGEDVTHIIVDKELTFADVVKVLGVGKFPVSFGWRCKTFGSTLKVNRPSQQLL